MVTKINSKSVGTLMIFFKSKPIQRLVVFICSALFLTTGLFITMNVFNFPNTSDKFNTQIPRKNIEIHTKEMVNKTGNSNIVQENRLQLHHPSSDNYDKSNSPYTVRDLLPKKTLVKFEAINDRIHLQLNHIPKSYKLALDNNEDIPMKLIYFYGNERNWYMKEGQSYFLVEKCPVDRCLVTYDKSKVKNADAVVFSNPSHMPSRPPWSRRSHDQIWAVYALETPSHTRSMFKYRNYLNWTMTYRRDSTITTPYFKFLYYNQTLQKGIDLVNLADGKTKKVAWMVSNCRLVSSGRMTYARELAKYIDVDIFGACGTKSCSKRENKKCHELIKQHYKFYLVFENSKCLSYMTEKLPQNALSNNAIPIVLGVSRSEIKEVAPPLSYIHVEDFTTPQLLADYLHQIDKDDRLFNEYFRWRRYGEMINTKTWCRFCSMLHERDLPEVTQTDIDNWWRKSGTCIGVKNWGY